MKLQHVIFNVQGLANAEVLRNKLVLIGIRVRAEIGSAVVNPGIPHPAPVIENMYGLIIEVPESMAVAARVILYEFFLWNKQRIHSVSIGGQTMFPGHVTHSWWDNKFSLSAMTEEPRARICGGDPL